MSFQVVKATWTPVLNSTRLAGLLLAGETHQRIATKQHGLHDQKLIIVLNITV